ncbi:MAG: hypothetical protein ABEN55_06495 [Bradymonadaceae bacterium]
MSAMLEWRDDGTWEESSHQLQKLECRQRGRHQKPSATVADSQSVSTTKEGTEQGFDTATRTDGGKRPLLVDTIRLIVAVLVTAVNIHDAVRSLMEIHRQALQQVELIWGDSKCGQKLPEWVSGKLDVEVNERPEDAEGFGVIE